MSDDTITVQRSIADLDPKDAIALLPSHVRRWSGSMSLRDFGAAGGEADATQAVLDALDAIRKRLGPSGVAGEVGGVLFVPGDRYGLSQRITVDFPLRLETEHQLGGIFQCESDCGFLLGPNGSDVGARASQFERVGFIGNKQRYLDRTASTAYTLGAARRPYAPLALGSTAPGATFPVHETDRGCHLVCVQAGTSSSAPLLDVPLIVPGARITDGTVIWEVRIDAPILIEASYCVVRACSFSHFDDGFVVVLGGDPIIADNTVVEHNSMIDCDGHGIYSTGEDASMLLTRGNFFQNIGRGCAIRDGGFLSSSHSVNTAVNCRWSYVGESAAASTAWRDSYSENSGDGSGSLYGGAWIAGPQLMQSGNIDRVDPRSQGEYSTGLRKGRLWMDFPGGYTRLLGGQGHEWDEWTRTGDLGAIKDAWTTDADDPGGYLRQAWLGVAGYEVREITSPRSSHGAGRWRFPRGYYVGKDRVYVGACDHTPGENDLAFTGTNLYRQGDRVLNSKPTVGAPEHWIALRDGGWGGGRQWGSVHTWRASGGNLSPGDGLEPTAAHANGHVYRVLRIEELVGGVWQLANNDHCVTSPTEPTWTIGPAEIYETGALLSNPTPGATGCRIVYADHGARGMRWGDGPIISSFEEVP